MAESPWSKDLLSAPTSQRFDPVLMYPFKDWLTSHAHDRHSETDTNHSWTSFSTLQPVFFLTLAPQSPASRSLLKHQCGSLATTHHRVPFPGPHIHDQHTHCLCFPVSQKCGPFNHLSSEPASHQPFWETSPTQGPFLQPQALFQTSLCCF